MTLNYEDLPVAGHRCRVVADKFVGTVRLSVFIDDRQISQKECPDPPCHEVIEIPLGSEGRDLEVIAEDDTGHHERLKLRIKRSEIGGTSP